MTLVALKAMVSQLQSEISELRGKLAELEENAVYMTDHMRFVNEQSRLIITNMEAAKRSFQSAQLASFVSNRSESSASALTDFEPNLQSSFDELLVMNDRLHETRQSLLNKTREVADAWSLITSTESELESIIESLSPSDPIIPRLRFVLDRMQP